jgi:hypothetical protein
LQQAVTFPVLNSIKIRSRRGKLTHKIYKNLFGNIFLPHYKHTGHIKGILVQPLKPKRERKENVGGQSEILHLTGGNRAKFTAMMSPCSARSSFW